MTCRDDVLQTSRALIMPKGPAPIILVLLLLVEQNEETKAQGGKATCLRSQPMS